MIPKDESHGNALRTPTYRTVPYLQIEGIVLQSQSKELSRRSLGRGGFDKEEGVGGQGAGEGERTKTDNKKETKQGAGEQPSILSCAHALTSIASGSPSLKIAMRKYHMLTMNVIIVHASR